MQKKVLLFLIIAIAPLMSFAQGCITIFSEDGDRFFLVLNGVKQNAAAQTNVRVDGLTNEYYSAKILFEDQSKPEISKNIPVKDAATEQFAEMTYKIKKTNKGEIKLRYFSATPIQPNYNPPPDMYYVHYGETTPVSAGSVTRTTQTTTVSNGGAGNATMNVNGGGVNMSINVADPSTGGTGLNMNVSVGDPNVNTNVTQTTTTTTSYSTTTTDGYNAPPPPPARAGCTYPMDNSSFSSAKQTIKNTSFEETKLSTAKSILNANCVSTDQIVEICNLFGFEQSKLDFAKFAFLKTTDKGNYFKISNVFSFDASKTELNNFISQ